MPHLIAQTAHPLALHRAVLVENETYTISRRLQFLDLSDEVILLILEEADNQSLWSLSFLSKRMHKMALSLYLERKNIPRPYRYLSSGEEIIIDHMCDTYDAFLGIQNALFFKFANVIRFAPPEGKDLAQEACALARMISRLTYAHVVQFDYSELALTSSDHGRTSRHLLINHVGLLLQALHNKHCFSLSFLPIFSLHDCRMLYDVGLPEVPARPNRHLRSLEAGSILLSPPFRKWLINSISRLTRLEIHGNCHDHWDFFAAHIPTLQNLSIRSDSLNTEAIIPFLQRHVHLKFVSLGGNAFGSPTYSVYSTSTVLGELRHLSAPPQFLSKMIQSCYMPKLGSLSTDTEYSSSEHVRRLFQCLTKNADHFPNGLSFSFIPTIRYLQQAASREYNVESGVRCITEIRLFGLLTGIAQEQVSDLLTHWLSLFPALERLQLHPGSSMKPNEEMDYIQATMKRIPTLQTAAIASRESLDTITICREELKKKSPSKD